MAIVDILENDDVVGILYNFIPTGERENNYFKKVYKDNINKSKDGYTLKKSKSILDFGSIALKFLIEYIEDFLGSIQKEKRANREIFVCAKKDISNSTKRKANKSICKSQTFSDFKN